MFLFIKNINKILRTCLWYWARMKKHIWEFTIPVQETDTGSLLIKFSEIFFYPRIGSRSFAHNIFRYITIPRTGRWSLAYTIFRDFLILRTGNRSLFPLEHFSQADWGPKKIKCTLLHIYIKKNFYENNTK